jgi:hypothetical protein
MAQNEIDGVDGVGGSKRDKAWAAVQAAREKMQMANQQKQNNNASTQDDTGNKQYSLVDKSVATDQQINPTSFDEDGGSVSGSYNAGSTISTNQKSNSDTDGGSSGGGRGQSKGDSMIVDSDKLPKGKLKEIKLSLFDEDA